MVRISTPSSHTLYQVYVATLLPPRPHLTRQFMHFVAPAAPAQPFGEFRFVAARIDDTRVTTRLPVSGYLCSQRPHTMELQSVSYDGTHVRVGGIAWQCAVQCLDQHSFSEPPNITIKFAISISFDFSQPTFFLAFLILV